MWTERIAAILRAAELPTTHTDMAEIERFFNGEIGDDDDEE